MQKINHVGAVYQGPSMGIGRPVSTEWLGETVEQFSTIAPNGVTLELRTNPAITYITPEEIEALDCQNVSGDRIEQAEILLGALAVDPLVDAVTITEGVNLKLSSVEFYEKHIRIFRLQAKLHDSLTSEHSHRYVVEAEKVALRSALGLSSRSVRSNRVPWHRLKLGLVKNQVSPLDQHEIQDMLNNTLSRAVPLGPVSPILL